MGRGDDAATGVSKAVELRRHTDNDGDALTEDGVRAALEIGSGLAGGYTLLVSSGMQRATQTVACFLAALGERVAGGVIVESGLRKQPERRWSEIYAETASLGAALRRVFERLEDGGRALAVGHSPTNEAAVFELTGEIVRPLQKGDGVLVVEEPRGSFRAEEPV